MNALHALDTLAGVFISIQLTDVLDKEIISETHLGLQHIQQSAHLK